MLMQRKKSRKVGRPKLPKGAAKGRIVPVRFISDGRTYDEIPKREPSPSPGLFVSADDTHHCT